MTRSTHTVLLAVTLLAAGAAWARQSGDNPTIAQKEATRTALSAVPGGKVKSAELEHENGKHVWSFDITRRGVPGATEIQVDANSGAIVSRKHESSEQESREAKSEAK